MATKQTPTTRQGQEYIDVTENEVSNTDAVNQDDTFEKDNGDIFLEEPKGGVQPEPKVEPAADPTTPAIPEKFAGKTLEEVTAMYGNLEKAYGAQGNEMGEMRKIADRILQNQLEAKSTPTETASQIDADALLEKPEEVVNSLVQNNPALQQITARLDAQEKARSLATLEEKHGPIASYGSDAAFINWVKANPVRMQRFQAADANHDFVTADDLISTYKEIKAAQGETKSEERDEQLAAVQTPRAGSGSSAATLNEKAGGKTLSRKKLMQMKIQDPRRYSKLQPQIMKAYAEGRVK